MKVNRYRTEKKKSKGCSLHLNTQLSAHRQVLLHEMKQNVNLSVCSGFTLARRVGEKESQKIKYLEMRKIISLKEIIIR